MTLNDMSLDLVEAFAKLGIPISANDVPKILQVGADKFMSDLKTHPSEESLSQVYIIINELRQQRL